jgi:uncharacterized membrane protein YhaH (DUF805 family)
MTELFSSEGRIPRSTYWKFYGIFYGLMILFGFLSQSLNLPNWLQGILGLMFFPLAIIGIIVQIKRWHDRDKSGWWVLINLVPCIGGFWSLIECGFLPGTPGPNQYGPDPRQSP